ncbi:uncharacterized protein [Drosophila takahashii]|uniref:uncharacterized protein isoform X1 n=1 Tax=Drosophila takahashii TaxID=29030 RepID=UPI0007E689B2|nr:uncharacterized protein LOC108058137 [Drosophila takahashii]
MCPLIVLLLLITAQVGISSAQAPTSGENYSVYKIYIRLPADQLVVDKLLVQPGNYSLWGQEKNYVYIGVSNSVKNAFLKRIRKDLIDFELFVEDGKLSQQRRNILIAHDKEKSQKKAKI